MLWALTDHENSVRDLAAYDSGTDVTTIANHRVYDSFGNLKSETNSAVDCLFGYTGRQLDEATGLQNNLNRWYDAKVGRWLSQDPIGFEGEDANLYRYAGNGPLNYVDPNGLRGLGNTLTGTAQIVTGGLTMLGGAMMATGGAITEGGTLGASTPVSLPAMIGGTGLAMFGADLMGAGIRTLLSGCPEETTGHQAAAAAAGALGSSDPKAWGDLYDIGFPAVAGAVGSIKAPPKAVAPGETLPPGFRQTGPNTWEGTIEIGIPEPPALPPGRGLGPLPPPGPGTGVRSPLNPPGGWWPPVPPGTGGG